MKWQLVVLGSAHYVLLNISTGCSEKGIQPGVHELQALRVPTVRHRMNCLSNASGGFILPSHNLISQLPVEDQLWFLHDAVRVLEVESSIRFLGSLLFLAVILDVAGCQHSETP